MRRSVACGAHVVASTACMFFLLQIDTTTENALFVFVFVFCDRIVFPNSDESSNSSEGRNTRTMIGEPRN